MCSSDLIFDVESSPEITIEQMPLDISTSEYGYDMDTEDDLCPQLTSLLSQIPQKMEKPLENLINQLKDLAKIRHPLSPLSQYRKKINARNSTEENYDIPYEEIPIEEKKKLQSNYQKAMEIYKPKRQEYFEKVNQLREILGLPLVKYLKPMRVLKPFKVFKRDAITNIRKTKPDARAKDLMPGIKARWAKMHKDEKFLYVLIARRENEKYIHEERMIQLDKEIEAIKKRILLH